MRKPEYVKDNTRVADGQRRVVSKPNGLWQAEYRVLHGLGTKTQSPWAPIGPECSKEQAVRIMNNNQLGQVTGGSHGNHS